MIKLEAKFQSAFNRWLKYNFHDTACFELKVARFGYLPFDAVSEHQLQNLKNSKHRKCIYKIPDDSAGQKPFDAFVLSGVQAFVVVQYIEDSRVFYIIDVDKFAEEAEKSSRKSLTRERASEIGIAYKLGEIVV